MYLISGNIQNKKGFIIAAQELAREHSKDNEFKDEEFPPLWQQLAMNISVSEIKHDDYNLLKEQFPKFDQVVGIHFIPRKKIDILLFERLGITTQNEYESLLREMYQSLLLEITLLKKMMK